MNGAIIQYNKVMEFLIIVTVRCGVLGLVENRKRSVYSIYLITVYSVLVLGQCILHK